LIDTLIFFNQASWGFTLSEQFGHLTVQLQNIIVLAFDECEKAIDESNVARNHDQTTSLAIQERLILILEIEFHEMDIISFLSFHYNLLHDFWIEFLQSCKEIIRISSSSQINLLGTVDLDGFHLF
jgi:hypothetical protein